MTWKYKSSQFLAPEATSDKHAIGRQAAASVLKRDMWILASAHIGDSDATSVAEDMIRAYLGEQK